MKELLEYVVKNLVDAPDAVKIEVSEKDEKNADVLIIVADDDIGKVIGRQGKIISAIRVLAKSVGVKQGIRYEVEILGGEKKKSSTPHN